MTLAERLLERYQNKGGSFLFWLGVAARAHTVGHEREYYFSDGSFLKRSWIDTNCENEVVEAFWPNARETRPRPNVKVATATKRPHFKT